MSNTIRTTTSLRKISSLRKKIWCVQGGQGSGKTYSILQILINHASSVPDRDIYIASAELSKMKNTVIKDFINIMKSFNLYKQTSFTNGTIYKFPNGSQIKFISLDKADIGKGLRSDIMFVNEANKVDFDTFSELTSRAKRVIIDYNPNREFWAHEEIVVRDDCDYINLTFEDNEALGSEERDEILNYYIKGYNQSTGEEINAYWANKWRVYGKGEIGRIAGAIFQNWKEGDFKEVGAIGYGLDFGSKDPDALVKISIDNANKLIYVKEELYQNNLSTDELGKLIKLNVIGNKLIVADSAAKRTIQDLKRFGCNITPVSKNPILDDIKLLQGYEFIVDPSSINLIIELSNWAWLDKKGEISMDKYNHLIDAFRYISQTLIAGPTKKGHKVIKRRR